MTDDQNRENKTVKKFSKPQERIRPSMRKELIHPSDYNQFILPYACEDCSHFASQTQSCTFGLNAYNHLASTQKKSYELSGQIALCRFQEID